MRVGWWWNRINGAEEGRAEPSEEGLPEHGAHLPQYYPKVSSPANISKLFIWLFSPSD